MSILIADKDDPMIATVLKPPNPAGKSLQTRFSTI